MRTLACRLLAGREGIGPNWGPDPPCPSLKLPVRVRLGLGLGLVLVCGSSVVMHTYQLVSVDNVALPLVQAGLPPVK